MMELTAAARPAASFWRIPRTPAGGADADAGAQAEIQCALEKAP
jgi:hypothetical protein